MRNKQPAQFLSLNLQKLRGFLWNRNFPSIHKVVSSCRLLHLRNSNCNGVFSSDYIDHEDDKQERKDKYGPDQRSLCTRSGREQNSSQPTGWLMGTSKIVQNEEKIYWDFIHFLEGLFPCLQ